MSSISGSSPWLRSLGEYLSKRIGTRPTLQASLLQGGRSNLTYLITDGERQLVLRRPPLGHVLPTAHDMAREFRVQTSLYGSSVPVAEQLLLCQDVDLIGAPFYIMEKVEGRVLRDESDALTLSPSEGERACSALVDILVALHSLDQNSIGLGDLGKPEGYLERQLQRWTYQLERSQMRHLEGVEEIKRKLWTSLPPSGRPTIIHNDYRFDNLMFSENDAKRIVAVFDWEMATIGDPLADLGLLLVYWHDASDALRDQIPVARRITTQPGFWTRSEVASQYEAKSQRSVGLIGFYMLLGYFKLAVVLEGIYARHLMGKTLGEGFEDVGDAVPALIQSGLNLDIGNPV